MHRLVPVLSCTLLAASLSVAASDPPEMSAEEQAAMAAYQAAATPGPQHAALAKTQGKYTLEVKSWQSPDAEPTVEAGEATRRMALDGRVLIEEVQSSMFGQPFTGMGLHGYDNVSGKYWGTWNDSMGTGLMVSEGTCDDAGHCQFTGSWNDPVTKEKVTARMTSRWPDADTEIFEMYGPGPDGQEVKMMELTYRRVTR